MEIVIDLPKRLIDYMNRPGYDEILEYEFETIIRGTVMEGTPLPKGHGDLIDKDALENAWHEEFLNGMSISSGMLNTFRDAPTIIEAESEEE